MRTKSLKNIVIRTLLSIFFIMMFQNANAESSRKMKNESTQLHERIDFGNSYILGQSIKSGAVYLLQRKKSDIESMLKVRENYRSEILEDFTVNDLKVNKKNIAKKKGK